MKSENPALTKLLASVMELYPKKIDLSLVRIKKLLDALGNPQQKMPPTFHIAGTNGKGSVFANISSILASSGATYHGYCSPHLMRFNERIIINGKEVGDDELMAALQLVIKKNNGDDITFFELTTAAAFLLFAENPADFLVCEVGLGGRLDSTNVIDGKKMAVFTPIDLDHQEFLGDSIEKIAFEKSGIITAQTASPIITAPQSPAVMTVLATQAKKNNKQIQAVDYSHDNGAIILHHPSGDMDIGTPSLLGAHQQMNAAAAAWAVVDFFSFLGRDIKPTTLQAGVEAVAWPARLQPLSPEKLGLPQIKNMTKNMTTKIWLDGCHNPNGVRALVAWLQTMPALPTAIIFTILNNRSAEDFLAAFRPLGNNLVDFFPVGLQDGDHRPHDPAHLATVAKENGFAATPSRIWQEALQKTMQYKTDGTCVTNSPHYQHIIICGSLYLAAEVLTSLAD